MSFQIHPLSFATLRAANMLRVGQFKNAKGELAHGDRGVDDWTPAQWLQATLGELGEYANVRKKFERGDIDEAAFKIMARKELADTVTYLDLLAARLNIDLGRATADKFNEVSARVKVDIFIDGDRIVNEPFCQAFSP